jgi:hypothetical protein
VSIPPLDCKHTLTHALSIVSPEDNMVAGLVKLIPAFTLLVSSTPSNGEPDKVLTC